MVLSFAIANFLGGQIAALTGAEGGEGEEKKEKVALKMETTVKEGLNDDAKFEDWVELENQPKNINVQKYYDLRDWVEFRTFYDDSLSLNEWKNNRSINTKFKNANDWLNKESWEDLNSKLVALNKKDENNENAVGFDSWMYFRVGFFDNPEKIDEYLAKMDPNTPLSASFAQHKSVVNEKGLNKYVDIFSIIGFVLIGFSLLIALLSRPLNKLMHGVE